MQRRAKILATMGPAVADEARMERLIRAGMDAARLNFSHATEDVHRATFGALRAAAARVGRPLAILQDLQGPKIRVGRLPGGVLELVAGEEIDLFYAEATERARAIPCSYAPLADEVRQGDRILLDDGRLSLSVLHSAQGEVRCSVQDGGKLSDHKGINLPGVALSTPAVTEKDRRDIASGRALGVDYVALSFVRRVADVELARELVGDTPLIAKIEKPEAIDQIDPIIDACDGIMVARGDLGVEMGPERVPMLQKCLIERANARGKLVITATEMLDSMRVSPRPTRAEVSDVANAVLDGTDALMLSGETAVGAYPVESVATMHRIVLETENSAQYQRRAASPPATLVERDGTAAMARAAVVAAQQIDTDLIICYTESGNLPRMISEFRPRARIIAGSERRELFQQLALHWGVEPLLLPAAPDTAEQTIEAVVGGALAAGLVEAGRVAIVATGSRRESPSDLLKVHLVV